MTGLLIYYWNEKGLRHTFQFSAKNPSWSYVSLKRDSGSLPFSPPSNTVHYACLFFKVSEFDSHGGIKLIQYTNFVHIC